ncbi:glycosyltransferase family 39 protein [Bailinhaonella thermotolerans]|uniref:Glycosyltransferase RgtA/B/C/D-like domain-containing protein n=1 Tax=Bailinhaonella thermotolerans TaxID=1070861 RepID=A0A3A4AB51_9ACTN|nr:glycosyltransferase family 39 protein [Bailinhaonella thermotolerans]RJL23280.1 hypothetical protein D5H75_33500 [Bailinhaonella thermotolerans]
MRPEPPETGGPLRPALAHPALTAALLTLALGTWGIAGPALWADEGATWAAATMPGDRFAGLLAAKDRILAPYYVFMRAWAAVSDSEQWLRLPSLLAAAASAAMTAALGRRLWSPRAGLAAGTLMALTPALTRYGQEARPYGLALAAVLGATLLLVAAADPGRGPGRRVWAGYAAALGAAALLHVLTLLIVPAHAAYLMGRDGRGMLLRRWACAVAAPALLAAGLLGWASGQRENQLSWPAPGLAELAELPVELIGSAALAAGLAVVAAAGRPAGAPPFLLVWAVAPVLLLAFAAQFTDLWTPRYVLFCLPACVLLAACALARLTHARVVMAVLAAAVLPAQLQVRGPDGHDSDLRAVAGLVTPDLRAGGGVVVQPAWHRPALYYYLPASLRPAADPLAVPLTRTPAGFYDVAEAAPAQIAARLGARRSIWVVRASRDPDPRAAAVRAALAQGFRLVHERDIGTMTVARYDRVAAPAPAV